MRHTLSGGSYHSHCSAAATTTFQHQGTSAQTQQQEKPTFRAPQWVWAESSAAPQGWKSTPNHHHQNHSSFQTLKVSVAVMEWQRPLWVKLQPQHTIRPLRFLICRSFSSRPPPLRHPADDNCLSASLRTHTHTVSPAETHTLRKSVYKCHNRMFLQEAWAQLPCHYWHPLTVLIHFCFLKISSNTITLNFKLPCWPTWVESRQSSDSLTSSRNLIYTEVITSSKQDAELP